MQSILPIFVIIVFGALFYRIKLAKYAWIDVLNEYVVKIGFPCLIFSTLVKLEWNVQLHGKLLVANSIFVLFCFALAIVVSRFLGLSAKMKRTLFLAGAYGNIAYLGIPVVEMFMGKYYLPEASLITACYLFWIFSVGMIYLEYSRNGVVDVKLVFKNLIKNPIIVAVIAGIFVLMVNLKMPVILLKPLQMISASVTPVILFSLGIFLGNSAFGKLKLWTPVLILTAFVLIIKPLIYFLTIKGFNYSVQAFHVSILDAGMPLAITPFALSKDFDLDADFLAKGIVLSTILSLITLSLLQSFLSAF